MAWVGKYLTTFAQLPRHSDTTPSYFTQRLKQSRIPELFEGYLCRDFLWVWDCFLEFGGAVWLFRWVRLGSWQWLRRFLRLRNPWRLFRILTWYWWMMWMVRDVPFKIMIGLIDDVFIWCPQYRLMAFSFLSPERLLGLVEEVDVGWEVEFLQLLLLPPEQHSFLKVMCHEICYLYFFLQNTLPGPHMNRLKRFLELFCFHHQWPTWGWGIPPVTYLGLRYEYP